MHTHLASNLYSHRFLNQKTAAKDPEKKIPSTAANATNLSAKVLSSDAIHFRAQSAFFFTNGTVLRERNRKNNYQSQLEEKEKKSISSIY